MDEAGCRTCGRGVAVVRGWRFARIGRRCGSASRRAAGAENSTRTRFWSSCDYLVPWRVQGCSDASAVLRCSRNWFAVTHRTLSHPAADRWSPPYAAARSSEPERRKNGLWGPATDHCCIGPMCDCADRIIGRAPNSAIRENMAAPPPLSEKWRMKVSFAGGSHRTIGGEEGGERTRWIARFDEEWIARLIGALAHASPRGGAPRDGDGDKICMERDGVWTCAGAGVEARVREMVAEMARGMARATVGVSTPRLEVCTHACDRTGTIDGGFSGAESPPGAGSGARAEEGRWQGSGEEYATDVRGVGSRADARKRAGANLAGAGRPSFERAEFFIPNERNCCG